MQRSSPSFSSVQGHVEQRRLASFAHFALGRMRDMMPRFIVCQNTLGTCPPPSQIPENETASTILALDSPCTEREIVLFLLPSVQRTARLYWTKQKFASSPRIACLQTWPAAQRLEIQIERRLLKQRRRLVDQTLSTAQLLPRLRPCNGNRLPAPVCFHCLPYWFLANA